MALTLTESLIRSRVNLTHENLEDIKSLSLPGTFHEKIVSIGTSLRKFSRLKSVDFSRNALDSLEGLEHLQLLERLNLIYYNNVSSLEELQRLKHNQSLKEIDLRLNPVTRNEPDYRLYLIHMLPSLQKLDDRGVSDRERQAALTHFSSSQASEMGSDPAKKPTASKAPLARVDMMSKLMNGPPVLADDDTAVIDMMNRNQGDFSKPRPLTGSSAKDDNVIDYTLESLKALDPPKQMRYKDKMMGDFESNVIHRPTATNNYQDMEKVDPRLIRYKEMYPNILAAPAESIQRIGEGHRDNNLMFCDEEEANLKYKGQGYFTPHPEGFSGKCELNRFKERSLPEVRGERRSRIDSLSHDDHVKQNKPRPRTKSLPGLEFLSDPEQAKERNLLFSLLNLVDRYWNGTKSLHKHPKFIEQSLQFISEYTMTQMNKEDEVKILRQKVEKLNEDNAMLKRAQNHQPDIDANLVLKRAKEDMERMHEEIRHYMNENRELQRRLDGWESGANHSRHGDGTTSDGTVVNVTMLENLQHKNIALAKEVEQMKTKLNQCDELANMLQESHRSLIETNNHLLRELETSKHKHQKEIEQMHWSYEQLKTTISQTSMIQPSPRNDLGTNNNTTSFSRSKNDILIV